MPINLKFSNFLKEALFNDYKFSVIAAGRRAGKTYAAAQWSHLKLLESRKPGLWVDTTQSNIDSYVERYFAPLAGEHWKQYSWDKQKKVLKAPNGNYMDFGSAERPENLEGFEYGWGVLNEAGHILKKPSLWHNTLYPMFKGKDTRVKVIGTPKGKNLFHKLYVRGQGGDSEYKSYHFTAYDSPYWDDNELETIKTQVPFDVFKQEYLAEFLENAGSVFRNIGNGVREPKPSNNIDIMAIDLAKHQDFTVVMWGSSVEKQVVGMDRFNTVEWGLQKQRIYNKWQALGKPKVIIDSTGAGDPIYDDLKAAGMNIEGFKFTSTSKTELIQGLVVAIENGDIFYPDEPVLIGELEVFGYDVSRMGNVRYSAPEGMHDDCVIALALFNKLIQSKVTVILDWI